MKKITLIIGLLATSCALSSLIAAPLTEEEELAKVLELSEVEAQMKEKARKAAEAAEIRRALEVSKAEAQAAAREEAQLQQALKESKKELEQEASRFKSDLEKAIRQSQQTTGISGKQEEENLENLSYEQLLELAKQMSLEGKKAPQPEVPPAAAPARGLEVWRLTSINQTGNTCGYWAAINAKAIEDVLEDEKLAESLAKSRDEKSAIVMQAATAYEYLAEEMLVEQEELICPRLVKLIQMLGAQNVYVLGYNPEQQRVYVADRVGTQLSLDEFFQAFNAGTLDNGNFICHLGNHWVLVSLVRYPEKFGKPISIYYLDSLNWPILPGGYAELYKDFIKNQIK